MTLSVMENHDTFKSALTDYQTALGDIPKILDQYLEYVARTGKPLFSWDIISCLILQKFENVCEGYLTEKSVPCVRNSSEVVSVEDLKAECLKSLKELTGVPFTIQRMCELLLSPRQNYSRLEKFLRGFIRVTKVVTTVNRVGQRITTESQSFANAMSPFQMNESGDNWLEFTNYPNESGSNERSISQTSEAILNIETKCELDYEDKCPEGPLRELSPPPFTGNSTVATTAAVYPEEPFFLDQQAQKTISMPPIGALFKPIDQLEAFVQTVSQSGEGTEGGSKKRPADDLGDDDVDEYASPGKRRRSDEPCSEAVAIGVEEHEAEAAPSTVSPPSSQPLPGSMEDGPSVVVETGLGDTAVVEPDQSDCAEVKIDLPADE